ncbi:YhdP family protein [Marinagarivorans algicola]|uniref:YhdP family phospholipid transporter n=1 Tax=Marinagarivorans algicola TaxID=1513270 RepID=UPI000AFBD60E|nr:DUF3971 domain-containing protein [Marinagarivorans algicola]
MILPRRFWKPFVRFVWGMAVFLVIFLAVSVQLGRFAFPYLNDYKAYFERQLSERLNANITLEAINASWDGLRPSIELVGVGIRSNDQQGRFFARSLSADINLLSTFDDWRLALGKLNVDGLNLLLEQNQTGAWRVVGLPQSSAGDRNFTIDDPLDIFLFGRRLELSNTHLAFKFRTGHVAEINVPSVSLENDHDFHRLKAKLDVDADSNAVYFIVEGNGDPRDDKNFSAKGYLQLKQFPLQKVVAATGLNKGLHIEPGLWSDGSRVDLQLWFAGSAAKGVVFNGGAKASGLPFELPGNIAAPAIPYFKYAGTWSKTQGLFAQVEDFGLSWADAQIPPLDLELRASLHRPVSLSIRELDVTAWSHVAGTLKLNNTIAKLQSLLQPGGLLRNIGVTLTRPEEGYFNLQANVIDAAVESWQGAPQVRHATGFVEASAFQGRMVIAANDGFMMHYPIVYKKPLSFSQASGEIAWFVNLEDSIVYVTSGLLHLKGLGGDGAGYLSLSLPFKKMANQEPEMCLVVGMRQSAVRYHENYVPYTIPSSLYQWLGQSIKDGDLTDGGFIYRGSLLPKPLRPRTLQLGMKIHSAELAFDPAWPILKNANASLLVDDMALVVAVDQGELLGNQLTAGRVKLIKTPTDKMALSITGNVRGDTADALALLRSSPVKDVAGEALAQFDASGLYTGSVELFIPLEGGLNDGWQDIQATLQNGKFALSDIGLHFDQVSGDIRYHTQQGLTAKRIQAHLWGQPVSASLNTLKDQQGRLLRLDFDGTMTTQDLHAWLKRPMFNYMQGKTQVAGWLKLPFDHPTQGIELQASTQLKGVTLTYPKPYAKAADEKMGLDVFYSLPAGQSLSRIGIRASNGLNSELLMQGGSLLGLDVGINTGARASAGDMRLHGELAHIDIKPWTTFVLEYLDTLALANSSAGQQALAEGVPVSASSIATPKFSMGVKAKTAAVDNVVIHDLSLWGKELDSSWYFDIETSLAVANYQRFNNGDPSKLHFEYLHLPKSDDPLDASEPKVSVLADVALEHLEPMEVKIDELAIAGEGWGHVSFDYRPVHQGLLAKNIRGNLRGLKNLGATLALYKRDVDAWETSFSGVVRTANIGNVMNNFGYPSMMTSQKASFNISVNWPGYPDQLDVNALAGTVDINLSKGKFMSEEGKGDSAFLNLIALLNFDTLVRRLRLDFSDLSAEGLAYDKVAGQLNFRNDSVHLTHEAPLKVDTTSADLQLFGDINLKAQTINSQLVATLPIAGNLAVAAALTAGLPAAVGVYVVGKLFKEQVNDFASVRYNVTGSWDDPKMDVDKIFESKSRSTDSAQPNHTKTTTEEK